MWILKGEPYGIVVAGCSQAGCCSCHPTVSIRSLLEHFLEHQNSWRQKVIFATAKQINKLTINCLHTKQIQTTNSSFTTFQDNMGEHQDDTKFIKNQSFTVIMECILLIFSTLIAYCLFYCLLSQWINSKSINQWIIKTQINFTILGQKSDLSCDVMWVCVCRFRLNRSKSTM